MLSESNIFELCNLHIECSVSEYVSDLSRKDLLADCVPLLRYISNHGNTTMYEYRTGKAPTSIVEPTLNLNLGETGETGDANEEVSRPRYWTPVFTDEELRNEDAEI